MAPPRKPVAGHEVSNEVLSEQVRGVSGRIDQIDQTLRAVAESLTAFVRLEERHTALFQRVETLFEISQKHTEEDERRHKDIFDRMKDDRDFEVKRFDSMNTRVEDIEKDIPPLKEIRKWAISLILGVMALVCLGVYNGYMNTRQDYRATTPAAYNSVPSQSGGNTTPAKTGP